jgi:acetate kinase
MTARKEKILAINGGSSSIKFALYEVAEPHTFTLHGKIERIGLVGTKLTFNKGSDAVNENQDITVGDYSSAISFLLDWLKIEVDFSSVKAIGHRLVHGMQHIEPEFITQALLDDLHKITPYDLDHLPAEIALIEAFGKSFPKLRQIACFDTAFHKNMPRVAKLLPIPRRFDTMGIKRYGFHGISYAYLMEELARTADPKIANGRVILAHLGSGASLAAVLNGQSIDTTMGFTPAGGVLMGSRPGDLDPGVAWYMMQRENFTPRQFDDIINHQSGLLGISETSSDMQDLLKIEKKDFRAAEAVELFCYQIKKCIGSYYATLGGLDALIFAGGIGEHAPVIRQNICNGLEHLGIVLEENRNEMNADIISKSNSRVSVRVIHTNEELMITRTVCRLLEFATAQNS